MGSMYIALEVRFDDSTILMVGGDKAFMEDLIIKKFNELAVQGEDELVLRPIDDAEVYTIRRKIIDQLVDDDGFEYEDNEGNPIRPDGTAILDSDEAEGELEEHFEVPGDYYWVIREIELDTQLDISTGTELYTEMTMSSTSPFEDEENTAIVTAA